MNERVAILLTLAASTLSTHALANSECPQNLGHSQMVPNTHVAGDIYRAVADDLVPRSLEKYPHVTVDDKGDHWLVWQDDGHPPGIVTRLAGGQLHMEIDKCTGAISHVLRDQ